MKEKFMKVLNKIKNHKLITSLVGIMLVFIIFVVVPEGTYDVYASYTDGTSGRSTLIDTGQNVTVGSADVVSTTINYYELIRNEGTNTSLKTQYVNSSGTSYTASPLHFLKGGSIAVYSKDRKN